MDVSDAERGSLHDTYSSYTPPRPRWIPDRGITVSESTGIPSNNERDNIQRRLRSFVRWAGSILPHFLAIGGFIFTGEGDEVECEDCGVVVGGWREGMVPLDVHRVRSPDCPFLKKWFGSDPSSRTSQANGFNSSRSKYMDYVDVDRRKRSFSGWPLKEWNQSPERMSEAGFFYIGSADRAKCFNCGLTLRDWNPEDDPFVVHKKYSPKCGYINYIVDVKEFQHKNSQQRASAITQAAKSSNRATTEAPGSAAGVATTKNAGIPKSYTGVPHRDVASRTPLDNHAPGEKIEGSSSGASVETTWKTSPHVQAVLEMGFSESLIRQAIAAHVRKSGVGFADATSLYLAVEELASP